jgi:hypothetical protein
MAHGGKREGAGRKKGAANKATPKLKAARGKAIDKALTGGETPLDIMTLVMRGSQDITERQFAAACAAAPYVHPKLSAMTLAATSDADPRTLSDAEIEARIAKLTGKPAKARAVH